MRHFYFLLFFTFSTTVPLAQSAPSKPLSAGAGNAPQNATDKENADRAQFDKELADVVNGLTDAELAASRPSAPTGAKAAPAAKPSPAEKRAAREDATRKLTDYIFSQIMDAGARGGLEEYKGSSGEPLPAAGGTKPTWGSRTQIPDADETMCFYKDNGVFVICGIYKSEPAAAAARREEALAALLKSIAERKGGTVSTDSEGRTVYLLGKGGMYLNRSATENAGEEYVSINAQGLD